jgi:hypothetical protein
LPDAQPAACPLRPKSQTLLRHAGLLLPLCLFLLQIAAAQEHPGSAKQDGAVEARMRNVLYRFTDSVAVQIKSLNGELVPDGKNEFPVFDDKESFRIRIDAAEMAIRPADLTNVLNSYAFAGPHSPVIGISVAIEGGHLKVKGKLHSKGDIPFETNGLLSPMLDGRVRIHSEKIKAVHVPVTGLMDLFGVDVADLIKSGKVPGVETQENDLILDLAQILPPPHIEGKVTAIGIQSGAVVLTFGAVESKATAAGNTSNGNYMSYRGNRLRFGKLTMTDADITLLDMDPSDPLDFYLDRYKDQLVAGYSKITPSFGLRAYVKDFAKLTQTAPASRKSTQTEKPPQNP